MKIQEIQAVKLNIPSRVNKYTPPRRPSWVESAEVANPMSKYPRFKRHRSSWLPNWGDVFVKVTVEDGTWGLGQTSFGNPVATIIDGHFAPMLAGENCFAIEKILGYDVPNVETLRFAWLDKLRNERGGSCPLGCYRQNQKPASL